MGDSSSKGEGTSDKDSEWEALQWEAFGGKHAVYGCITGVVSVNLHLPSRFTAIAKLQTKHMTLYYDHV